jgi:hypothetical protein
MEGQNFWQGFIAAAATKTTSFGPTFDNYAANITRAAVAGGTAAVIARDKFENGAITGAFSYAFNDWLDRPPPPEDRIDPDYTIENLAAAGTGVYGLARAGFSAAAGWWMAEGAEIVTAESAANAANGVRLSQQLLFESANSVFTPTGELTEGAIMGAQEIIPAGRLGNSAIPQGFAKFTTETFRSPSGPFTVRFYMNPSTGKVLYNLDYKTLFLPK